LGRFFSERVPMPKAAHPVNALRAALATHSVARVKHLCKVAFGSFGTVLSFAEPGKR
jgi:hypothetical protein